MKINLRSITKLSTVLSIACLFFTGLHILLDLNKIDLFNPDLLSGHGSLTTLLILTLLALIVPRIPLLSKGTAFIGGLVTVYAAMSLFWGTHVSTDLWLSNATGLTGVLTDDSTLISAMILGLSISLLRTRAHILGATLAFVACLTPFHGALTHLITSEHATGDLATISTIYLFFLSTSILLRYLGTSTFLRALTSPTSRQFLMLVTALGFVLQQMIVIRDAMNLSNVDNFERLLIFVSIQYLLLKLAFTQVSRFHSASRYGASMHRNATIDPMTKCGNRLLLKETLKQLTHSHHPSIGVIIFDIDFFKHVNDRYGHDTGDRVLTELVSVANTCLSENETLIRWGGEEFLILTTNNNIERLKNIAEAIRIAVDKHSFSGIKDLTISLGAAVGITNEFDQVVRLADSALYYSKNHGRNQSTIADDAFVKETQRNASNLNVLEIEQAALNRELYFVAHPINDVITGDIVTIEALLRWQRKEGDVLAPRFFVEKLNQLILGNHDVRLIMNRMKIEFIEGLGEQYPNAAIAFNTTPSEVLSEECSLLLSRLIQVSNHFNRPLVLEFSETAVNHNINIDQLKHLMLGYKELGIRFAVDYFGSEGDNLSLLMNLDIDIIKLAPSIAHNLNKDNNSFKIVSSLWLMLHHLGVEIVVEGIDTEYQYRMFKGFGYRLQQGYLFGEPADIEQIKPMSLPGFHDKSLSGKLMSTSNGSTDVVDKPIISS